MSADLLRTLKFVQGAVSKKDLVPGMTHFLIENSTIRAYNGVIALSSPIAFDIDCKPKASQLVAAITHCDEKAGVSLTMTPKKRLSIKSGAFRAFVDCVEEQTPHVLPEGDYMEFDGEVILQAFRTLENFIGTDASRPWSTGVLLRNQSAFATNNVILVEYWLGSTVPTTVNIPAVAIREMLRINEPPIYAQVTDHSITFHYADGRWVRSQLLDIKWPDLDPILNCEATAVPLEERVFEGLEKLRPFTDKWGRVFLTPGIISTSIEKDDEGATFEVPEFQEEGIYQIDMLRLLRGVATSIDLTLYPKPCPFFGDRLRGVIIGMRPL